MSAALAAPCLAACVAALALFAALRVGRIESGETAPSFGRAALPKLLRHAIRWARSWHGLLPIPAGRGILRRVDRHLARAGLREDCDAQTWLALLLLISLLAMLLAALPLSWAQAPAVLVPLCGAGLPWLAHSLLLGRSQRRSSLLTRELPAGIDVLVLCLEAGASLGAALKIASERGGAGPVQDLFAEVLAQVRAGKPRAVALRAVMERWDVAAITALFTALIQADTRGMSLGVALRAQSAQCVSDRFVRAERAALQAPVKLLLPLLTCIFPCTFIVIAVPIAARFMEVNSP